MSICRSFFLIFLCLFWLVGCSHMMDKSRDREKARVYLQLAADQYVQKEYGRSVDAAQESLKYDPEYAAVYNHLGIVYMETKRFGRSEESFKKALTLQKDYPEVLNNLGVLFNRQERFADAIPHFEKALEIERYATPENALTNLGYSYFRLGNMPKAKLYQQKALDISPGFCLANKNMGDCYAKEKNFIKAAEYFQKAVTTCPFYSESQYKLGLALMKIGRRQIAKNEFEKLVERHKEGPYVERSNEVLKLLH